MQMILTAPRTRIHNLVLVLGASILLAISAWISIPLPFTPVPISFTAQLVLLLSVLMGKRGAYATGLYLAQGALGLPVFANGGCTLAYFMGPTGGYLIGFLVASYLVGSLSEKLQNRTPAKIFGIMLLGNLCIYACGVPHLGLLIGFQSALLLGFVPHIGGDLLKLALAQRLARFNR
jgi:biotin transport system substrate-specific component